MAAGGEGKDDPYYIQNMHDWFATHATAFEIYFDRTAGDGDHQLNGGKFPQAAALVSPALRHRVHHTDPDRDREARGDGHADSVQHPDGVEHRDGVQHTEPRARVPRLTTPALATIDARPATRSVVPTGDTDRRALDGPRPTSRPAMPSDTASSGPSVDPSASASAPAEQPASGSRARGRRPAGRSPCG